eukprot:2087495-Prymnesium_polylepis.1
MKTSWRSSDCSRRSRRGRSSGEKEGHLYQTRLEFTLEHRPTAMRQPWLGTLVVGWAKDSSRPSVCGLHTSRGARLSGSGPGPGRLRMHGRSLSLALGPACFGTRGSRLCR